LDCIFCKIIKKQIPSSIVYEDEKVFAFNDIAPKAPVHVLVIPKEHISAVSDIKNFAIISDLFRVLQKLAKELGIEDSGYRIVANNGPDAGQAVDHLHFHLLGGRPLHWPPG
jgi:histidine triad (HIT) family protein